MLIRGRMAALLAVWLAGCGVLDRDVSPQFAELFMGKPVNDVIGALGPPSFRAYAAEGSAVGELLRWEWAEPREVRVPEYRSVGGTGLITVSGYRRFTDIESCLYEVRTDADGIVTDQRIDGRPSYCRARLPK